MMPKEDNWDNKNSSEQEISEQKQIKEDLAGPIGLITIALFFLITGNAYNIFILVNQGLQYVFVNGFLVACWYVLEFLLIYGGIVGVCVGFAWAISILMGYK
jgi:hypothetical protein